MTIKNKMLLGALLLVTSAAWAAPATAGSTNTSGISKYELSSFIADFKHFKPGDTVPEMYRTDEYNIKQWQLRNLPAPGNDSNLLIVFYVQIMPDDFVMQLHRF
ncbi:Nickel/cobalt homeostasis protein RcnB [Escherichia coli]|nr:periplasmic modulator of Ni and Co efflux [Escherichia coli]